MSVNHSTLPIVTEFAKLRENSYRYLAAIYAQIQDTMSGIIVDSVKRFGVAKSRIAANFYNFEDWQ